MDKNNKILFSIIRVIIIGIILNFSISLKISRKAAVDYLQILTIKDEASYQKVKKNIYKISSDEVRNLVFHSQHYEGLNYNSSQYSINNIKCIEIKGFNHFIFSINYTMKDWKTIESLVYVDKGRIYNIHRKD